MSIISRLIGAGDVLLYHDYRSGSFRDFSGNNNHGTPTSGMVLARSGMHLSGTTDQIEIADNAALRTLEGTWVLFGDFTSQTTTERLISKRDAGGKHLEWYMSAAALVLVGDGPIYTLITDIKYKKYVAVNFKETEAAEGFIDGVSVGNYSGAVSITENDAPIIVGNLSPLASQPIKSRIAAFLYVDRRLTASEHAELYAELQSKKWNQKTISIASRQSLDFWADKLDGYDEILTGGSYTAGQTIPGTSIKVAAGSFTIGSETIDGETSKYIECTNSSGRFYIDLTNDPVYQTAYGTWKFHLNKAASSNARVLFAVATTDDYNGAGQLGYLTSLNSTEQIWLQRTFAPSIAHLFNTDVNVVNDGSYDEYRITRDRSGRFHYYSNDTLVTPIGGTPGTNPVTENTTKLCNYSVFVLGLGDKVGLKTISNRPLLSLDPLSKVTLSTLGNGALETVSNVTSGPLPGTPFEVQSGTFKTTYDTINGKPVKCIECVADGLIYSPWSRFQNNENEAAYGTWEFYVYRSSGNNPVILFNQTIIGSSGGGNNYNFILRGTGDIDLRRGLTNIINGSAVADDTWHEVKVTRDSSGYFTLLANGINQGAVTDTNYSVANYIVFDIDAGDKIAIAGFDGTPLLLKRKGVA